MSQSAALCPSTPSNSSVSYAPATPTPGRIGRQGRPAILLTVLLASALLATSAHAARFTMPLDDTTGTAPFSALAPASSALRSTPFSLMNLTPGGSSSNLPVSTATGDQFWASAVPDGSGGMIVAWQDSRNASASGLDIYAQHVLACGTLDPAWPAGGVALTTAPGDQSFPAIVGDGSGGAFVAWSEQFTYPAMTGAEDIFAQHLLSSGAVDPAWPANGAGVCTAPGSQVVPHITSDGAHGAFITWDDRRFGLGARRAFVQHLLSTGVDPAWTPNGIRACPGVEAGQANPVICSDGAGGAIVAWNDRRTNFATQADVFAQRMSPTGALLWGPNAAPACTAPGSQTLNGGAATFLWLVSYGDSQGGALTPDGAGGCFLTWWDGRNNPALGDIYAQHLAANGSVVPGWDPNGVPLCTDPGDQNGAVILADGAGGAIATWYDLRAGVFAQHVTGAGTVDGPANGLLLSNAATAGFTPVEVPDGLGGAVLAWSDPRNFVTSDYDMFATHVSTSGGFATDPGWPANGALVSNAAGYQTLDGSSAVITNGAGGAFVAMDDARNLASNGADLYVQEVLANGTLPVFAASGHVRASCPVDGTGLQGVTVDAYQVGTGALTGTGVTDASGAYAIPNLYWGSSFTITEVTPLDYSASVAELGVDGCAGPADFSLQCLPVARTQQSMGFWKHQVGVATGDHGAAQVSAATLCEYLDLIAAHFNNNAINQVIVYQPPASGVCADKLQVARTLLDLQGNAAMIARARQQLMSLLLNVAAGYIGQTQVISADGATVSQAITYCDHLIDSPTGDYERAKTIADTINNGQLVPTGMIPLSTQQIAYARGSKALEFAATPNPGHGELRFQFAIRRAGPVSLSVFDVSGRQVVKLVDGTLAAGRHTVTWDSRHVAGHDAEQGVYFARLTAPEGVERLTVLKLAH